MEHSQSAGGKWAASHEIKHYLPYDTPIPFLSETQAHGHIKNVENKLIMVIAKARSIPNVRQLVSE